jgi:subtilisin family serine protease
LKHVAWLRDQNHNFIDDEIERRFGVPDSVNVIVDLNRCYTPPDAVVRFAGFGRIRYIGRIITFVLLNRVPFSRLDSLAGSADVAMVEWQAPGKGLIPYSGRAVEATKSIRYAGSSAADRGLTGNGVTIAFLDSGVDDPAPSVARGHEALPPSVHGFDAVIFSDTNGDGVDEACISGCTYPSGEPGDGRTNPCATNPADCNNHGTYVAGVALSRGLSTTTCYLGALPQDDSDPSVTSHCVGVSPGAQLVDIRVLDRNNDCESGNLVEGLEWLALHADEWGIRVANVSVALCVNDDGSSAVPQLVDYLVSMGVSVVAGHGNSDTCPTVAPFFQCSATTNPPWVALPPGTASMAITVGGENDHRSVDRSNDTAYANGLRGPLCDYDGSMLQIAKLKPDICAPAEHVLSTQMGPVPSTSRTNAFDFKDGTSLAAPHVSGAAALLIEDQPSIDPASLKDLLLTKADPQHNTGAYTGLEEPYRHWDTRLGIGILNVGDAAHVVRNVDVRFPTCVGDPGPPGAPCLLAGSLPPWKNEVDILTDPETPVAGVENTLIARVENTGAAECTVQVEFGVYRFGTGMRRFYEIGKQQVTIPASTIVEVRQTWIPSSEQHQCAQVSIAYGADLAYWNNTTQRNLSVVSSSTLVSGSMWIENPFMAPAAFRVVTASSRKDWTCKADVDSFKNNPLSDYPRRVRVSAKPRPNAPIGKSCDCDVFVYGGKEAKLVGGATVRFVRPRPCLVRGRVVDSYGRPLRGVRITFTEAGLVRAGASMRARTVAQTGINGVFSARLNSALSYRARLEAPSAEAQLLGFTPRCGDHIRFQLSATGAKLLR